MRRGGGMAYTPVSKTGGVTPVWVQLPPPAFFIRGVEQKGSLRGKDDFPLKNNFFVNATG